MVEVLEVLNLLSFIPSFVAEGLEFVDKLPATATRLEVSVPVVVFTGHLVRPGEHAD